MDLQEKFEEKWLTHIVGKLNDEDATRVAEEAAAVRRRLEQAQVRPVQGFCKVRLAERFFAIERLLHPWPNLLHSVASSC